MGEVAQVVESCLVTPSTETPRKALWLSPLDLLTANRGHVPLVHFYRPSGDATDFFDVTRLKAALGKALVAFYPFAGRLDVDQDGRLQIDCNGQGALFLVAYTSHITVDDFSDLKPSSELRRLLVPHMDSAEAARILCAIQVTFLKCGGVALGAAFHFFQTWSAFSRDGERAVVDLPCHNRALLSARAPPVVRPDALSIFCPTLNLSEPSVMRAESNRGGFVYLMDSPQGDGGVRVVMCIEAAILNDFEQLLYASLSTCCIPCPSRL